MTLCDSIVNLKQLDFHYQEISVNGRMDNPRVATKRSNKNSFFDVATSDEHIYVIYSGKTLEKTGLSYRSLCGIHLDEEAILLKFNI